MKKRERLKGGDKKMMVNGRHSSKSDQLASALD